MELKFSVMEVQILCCLCISMTLLLCSCGCSPVSEYAGTVGVDLAVPATPAGCMSMADVFKL
jgi:hypothetical protein